MKRPPKGPRKSGRRPLEKSKRREKIVDVRVSAEEYAALLDVAERAAMRPSTFLRESAFTVRIIAPPSLVNREAYAELLQLGKLLNQTLKAVHQRKITNVDQATIKKLFTEVRRLRLALMGADR